MPDASEEKLPELVSRIVDDAKEVARAEIALVKAQVGARITAYRTAAILFAAAAVLGLAGLIALVVGILMTLAPSIGAGEATVIVVVATLAGAGLVGWLGARRLQQG